MHTRTITISSEQIPKSIDYETLFHPELRAVDESEGIIEGLAAPFGEWTPVGGYLEQMTADTFRRSVTQGSGVKAPLMTQHDYKEFPVGKAIAWEIREEGLHGTWQIDMKSERAAEVYRLASEGYLTGLSVGFVPGDEDRSIFDDDQGVPMVIRGPAQLREVSVCSVAAYPQARITMNRSPGMIRAVDPRIEAWRKKFQRG